MATTLRTVARSQLRTQRLRFALTKLGIALAAFFLCSVFILNVSITESSRQAVSGLYAKADAVVQSPSSSEAHRGQGLPISQSLYRSIEGSPLVEAVWPVSTTYDPAPLDSESSLAGYTILRQDLPADMSIFPYDLAEGSFPTEENQVLISSSSAEQHGLSLGQELQMSDFSQVTPAMMSTGENYPTVPYTVSGIFRLDSTRAYMASTFFTLGSQNADYTRKSWELSGTQDASSSGTVLIKFKDSSTTLADFEGTLNNPSGNYLLRTAQEQIEHDVESDTPGYQAITYALLAAAALALFMAGFVIANTLQVLSHQRSRELALLRVLGAQRGGLTRMLLAEAALLGFGSGIAGVLTAYLFALVVKLTEDNFYIYISWLPAASALAICTLATVVSSLLPAIRAYRTSPLQALATTDREEEAAHSKLATTGVVLLLLAGLVLAGLGLGQAQEHIILIATFVLALACILLLPLLLRPALRLLGVVSSPHSPVGFAMAGALRSRGQTSASSRMIFTCTALVAAVLTGYATVQATSLDQINRNNPFDVASSAQVDYSSALAAESELEQVGGLRGAMLAPLQGEITSLQATAENRLLYSVDSQRFADIWPAAEPLRLETGQVLISRQEADRTGLANGDRVTAEGTLGETDLSVIITDVNLPYLLIDRATGQELSGEESYQLEDESRVWAALFAQLDPTISQPEQSLALADISRVTGVDGGQLSGALMEVESLRQVLDNALYATLGLLGIALLISLVGIANTQVLSAYQRQRENALLRSLGMSRRALRAVMSREIIILASLSVTGGVLIGVVLALLLLQMFTVDGTRLHYAFHWQGFLITWLAGIVLAWLSGVLPAYRASRVPPVTALRQVT